MSSLILAFFYLLSDSLCNYLQKLLPFYSYLSSAEVMNRILFNVQVGEIGCLLTIIYTILILPTLVLYRSMETETAEITEAGQEEVRSRDKPPLYHPTGGALFY